MMHSTFSTTSLSDRKYLCFSFYWNFYRWVEVCYGYKTLVWELLFCNGRFLLFFSVSCCSFNSIIESFAWLHLKSLRTYKKVHLEMLQEIIIRNILLLLEFHQNLSKSLFTIQISELLLYSLGMTEFHFPKFYLKYFTGYLRWRTSISEVTLRSTDQYWRQERCCCVLRLSGGWEEWAVAWPWPDWCDWRLSGEREAGNLPPPSSSLPATSLLTTANIPSSHSTSPSESAKLLTIQTCRLKRSHRFYTREYKHMFGHFMIANCLHVL